MAATQGTVVLSQARTPAGVAGVGATAATGAATGAGVGAAATETSAFLT